MRVYSVDPTLNHDECMKTFDDNGIYVLSVVCAQSVSNADVCSGSMYHYLSTVPLTARVRAGPPTCSIPTLALLTNSAGYVFFLLIQL